MDPKSITGEDEEVMWVEAEGEFSSAVTTRMIPDFPRAGFKRLLEGEWEKKKNRKKKHTHTYPTNNDAPVGINLVIENKSTN